LRDEQAEDALFEQKDASAQGQLLLQERGNWILLAQIIIFSMAGRKLEQKPQGGNLFDRCDCHGPAPEWPLIFSPLTLEKRSRLAGW